MQPSAHRFSKFSRASTSFLPAPPMYAWWGNLLCHISPHGFLYLNQWCSAYFTISSCYFISIWKPCKTLCNIQLANCQPQGSFQFPYLSVPQGILLALLHVWLADVHGWRFHVRAQIKILYHFGCVSCFWMNRGFCRKTRIQLQFHPRWQTHCHLVKLD